MLAMTLIAGAGRRWSPGWPGDRDRLNRGFVWSSIRRRVRDVKADQRSRGRHLGDEFVVGTGCWSHRPRSSRWSATFLQLIAKLGASPCRRPVLPGSTPDLVAKGQWTDEIIRVWQTPSDLLDPAAPSAAPAPIATHDGRWQLARCGSAPPAGNGAWRACMTATRAGRRWCGQRTASDPTER